MLFLMAGVGAQHGVLRIVTCGSADAGKSTLISQMLRDADLVREDHPPASPTISESARGTVGGIGLAILMDGAKAKSESVAAMGVTYRFFSTPSHKFILADVSGTEQATRGLAATASTAQAAVMVVDARKGIVPQIRRQSFIARSMGVDTVILTVNKMDLVDFDQRVFEQIVSDYRDFAAQTAIKGILEVPVAALSGENVLRHGAEMPWYRGPALLKALESLDTAGAEADTPFRLPVELLSPLNEDSRGFHGTVAAGTAKVGNKVQVFPSGHESRIAQIVGSEHKGVEEAHAGESVTLILDDELDVSPGDVIAPTESPPEVTDQFAAHLIWMGVQPLIPERRYTLKIGSAETAAAVTELKYKVNFDTLEHVAAKTLGMNEVAFCNFSLDKPLAVESRKSGRVLSAFILVDPTTKKTVGAGTISFSLRRATNVLWQELEIGKSELAGLKSQKPAIVWLTGLSGAGKSTIANLVQKRLHAIGRHTYLLDGDNLRHGLNRDLGFVEADRVENIRRVAEVAKLFVDSGTLVLVCLISPYRQERAMARNLVEREEFIEVFVDTPLAVCEERDPKGLYRKARAGSLINFTGIDAPYEPPESPEIHVDGGTASPEQAAEKILHYLGDRGYLGSG